MWKLKKMTKKKNSECPEIEKQVINSIRETKNPENFQMYKN